MKRTFIVLLIIALSMGLFSACASAEDGQNGTVATGTEGTAEAMKDIDTFHIDGVLWDIIVDWDNPYGAYEEAVVPNEEVAVGVATAIFNGLNLSQGTRNRDLRPQAVFYNKEEEIWIVLFGEDPVDGMYSTFGYSIAIQKSDGKVLKMWRD